MGKTVKDQNVNASDRRDREELRRERRDWERKRALKRAENFVYEPASKLHT